MKIRRGEGERRRRRVWKKRKNGECGCGELDVECLRQEGYNQAESGRKGGTLVQNRESVNR